MIFLIWNIFVFIIFCFRDRTPRTPLLKSKHRVMLITVLIFFQKKNPIDVNRDQERGAGSSMFETDFCFGSSRVEILVFVKKTKILPLWNNLYDTGNVTPALWLQEFLIFERPLFLKSIFFFQKNGFQKWFIWNAKHNALRFLEIRKSGRPISHDLFVDILQLEWLLCEIGRPPFSSGTI